MPQKLKSSDSGSPFGHLQVRSVSWIRLRLRDIGTTTSAAEQIAARARNARVVKCFNVTGAENMADPGALDGPVFMPVAGDDADARADVLALATRLGFDAVDAGPLRAARFTEAFAMTWIHLAFAAGQGRAWAFSRAQRRA